MSKRKKFLNKKPTRSAVPRRSILTEDLYDHIQRLVKEEAWQAVFEMVLPLADQAPDDALILELLLDASYHVQNEHTLEHAAVLLSRVLPRDPGVVMRLAMAYEINDRPMLALRTYQNFLSLAPEHEGVQSVRDRIPGLNDRARQFLDDVELRGPGAFSIGADFEEMRSLYDILEFAKARHVGESVVKRAPGFIRAQHIITLTYMAEANYPAAAGNCRKMLEIEPDNVYALAYLVEAYCRIGDRSQAAEFAERMKESSAPCLNRRWIIADALVYCGDDDGVLNVYRTDPGDDEADETRALILHYAAAVHYRRGGLQEAERLWHEALEWRPGFQLAETNLADLTHPVGMRDGPVMMEITTLIRWRLVIDIQRLMQSTESLEARQRESRRLIRQNPELVPLAGLLLDLGDEMAAEIALTLGRLGGDPGILAALRRFSAGRHGSDSRRTRAFAIVRLYDPSAVNNVMRLARSHEPSPGAKRSHRAALILRTALRLSHRTHLPA